MASACLNRIGVSPENLMDCSPKYSSYSWFTHRRSISNESDALKYKNKQAKSVSDPVSDPLEESEFDGFEFRLEDPVMMLPADELFSDGKLVPMQFSVNRNEAATSTAIADSPAVDPYLYSPRAPRCSSRWKELLGFGKPNQTSNNSNSNSNSNNNNNTNNNNNSKRSTLSSSSCQNTTRANTTTSKSIRQLLYHRSSKSSHDSSINLPLLKETDTESVSISSRPSLTSSSSGNHDVDDLPRLSLDSNKPNPNPSTRPKTRLSKPKPQSTDSKPSARVGRTVRRSTDAALTINRCLSVDSPRMNSSGKIVFHSLERSSSSPSSLIGGPRFKHRGMERSYSSNVRVSPVLNVPVCSIKSGGMFGFPMFTSGSNNGGLSRSLRGNKS
ncbi:uncharacterized protein LOC143558125 [Bidens hawaiensis]|uniref:uncharacterized protein LOC143558125 n=1 Tax=Bidens hawaiensis TaxID=980011 RepID=UPI0040498DA8